jgi:hypothetical protein
MRDLDPVRPRRELRHRGTDMVGGRPPSFCYEQSCQERGELFRDRGRVNQPLRRGPGDRALASSAYEKRRVPRGELGEVGDDGHGVILAQRLWRLFG